MNVVIYELAFCLNKIFISKIMALFLYSYFSRCKVKLIMSSSLYKVVCNFAISFPIITNYYKESIDNKK